MKEHEGATPRPWAAEGLQIWPAHERETFIADCFRGRDQATEEANAALIVAAVNAYDPDGKVKALLIECADVIDVLDDSTPCDPRLQDLIGRIADALKAMEG